MIISITDEPVFNAYVTSLLEEYKRLGINVICGSRNFFYSNLLPDMLHIQWPEKLYSWYPFSALENQEKFRIIEEKLKFFKSSKVTIVHTIHNLLPHDKEQLNFEKDIFNLIIAYSDILVHHCRKSIDIVKKHYPAAASKLNLLNHHPDYLIDFKEAEMPEARKRFKINNDAFVILNFGNQRRYKNEDFIKDIFKRLNIKEKFLFTAGNFDYDDYNEVQKFRLKIRNRLRERLISGNKRYRYKKISSKELPYIFSCADLVFLGHSSGLNSGVLPLAATFKKPVVFPDIGCFKEQMNGWIYESFTSGDKESAVEAILKMYNKLKKKGNEDNSGWLKNNSWELHVKKILEAADNFKKQQLSAGV